VPETTSVAFRVNGQQVSSVADPDTPLLYVLRNDLHLKGTRFGCGTGDCGACTVHVDGRAERSCLLPLGSVESCDVTTIEGLGRGPELDSLQQAFIEEQAGQCGYCLSGILMAARALLDDNPRPGREEITQALDGNLCRCAGMARMISAVERASRTPKPAR
jgi:nicotinate dehydrogenase subunit A